MHCVLQFIFLGMFFYNINISQDNIIHLYIQNVQGDSESMSANVDVILGHFWHGKLRSSDVELQIWKGKRELECDYGLLYVGSYFPQVCLICTLNANFSLRGCLKLALALANERNSVTQPLRKKFVLQSMIDPYLFASTASHLLRAPLCCRARSCRRPCPPRRWSGCPRTWSSRMRSSPGMNLNPRRELGIAKANMIHRVAKTPSSNFFE